MALQSVLTLSLLLRSVIVAVLVWVWVWVVLFCCVGTRCACTYECIAVHAHLLHNNGETERHCRGDTYGLQAPWPGIFEPGCLCVNVHNDRGVHSTL